jgi:hypothetical protein
MSARSIGLLPLRGLMWGLALGLLAGCAGAGGGQEKEEEEKGQRSEGTDAFTIVAPRDVEEQIDLGDRGPSVGDVYVFSGPIYDESEQSELGRIDGQCTTTSSPGPSAEARRLCIANATFAQEHEGAEIDTQGVGRLEAEDVVFAVTGGTGDYRDVRGQATFEFRTDGDVVISYELETVPIGLG